ncbi:hypothetical protein HDA37_000901 [Pseudonocardia antarctica]|uniref:Uncharacterized protein n=1 Tax=Pseudonocardia alni TaxID=33907 RepID=A0A852W3V3_PSEA5|nr:hypothetical protein [Pseudonocardia antarctica]OJG08585.1 hypothetical protein BG618_00204 [Pseudonocardia autotrophica]
MVLVGEGVIPGGTSSSACVVRGFGVLRLPVSSE